MPNHAGTPLLSSLRQQYDNDSALLEHMDREHSKLRAEHEDLAADYDDTSKKLGKALADLATSEAKRAAVLAELEQARQQIKQSQTHLFARTKEMTDANGRLSEQLNARARNEARLVNAFESIIQDTDGGDVDPDADVLVGEIRRVFHEATMASRPNPRCTCAPDVNDGDPGTWCTTCRQGPRAAALIPPESAQQAEPFYPDDDCSEDESAGGDPRSGCAITPTCTLRCYIRHQEGEAQLNDALVDNAPNAPGADRG